MNHTKLKALEAIRERLKAAIIAPDDRRTDIQALLTLVEELLEGNAELMQAVEHVQEFLDEVALKPFADSSIESLNKWYRHRGFTVSENLQAALTKNQARLAKLGDG